MRLIFMTLSEVLRESKFRLKYLRFNIFQFILRPVQAVARKRRMRMFASRMNIQANASILDLGGQPRIWAGISPRLNIVILNLSGIAERQFNSHHNITYIDGDACNVAEFSNGRFDIVFSNSVIEHVGDDRRQREFAREVKRLGEGYWVQTPSKYFPVEAHCGMPFWWFYPKRMQQYFLTRWRRKLPEWTEMVEGTRVLDAPQLKALFPDGELTVERFLGIPKSYIISRQRGTVRS
jgi:SAM-dependent methyltransferase